MQYKDYYQTLGVARDASPEEIKRAYRRLARKFHPDVSKEPNAEARFKEINEAHEVLHDAGKRAAYDALGTQWRAGQDFRPPPGAGGRDVHFGPEDIAGFSDFFTTLFGREFQAGARPRAAQDRRRRGQDRTLPLAIDLEEAWRGGTHPVRLDPAAEAGAARTLNVRIPAGVTPGQRIRLAGQGQPGRHGGPAGDLYLEIGFKPHRLYTVEERNILLRLPLTPWEAALGATVTVPTLGGPVSLRIPPGSQSGQRLRLRGRGLSGDPPGDAFVILEIHTPPAETEAAREAYRLLAERIPFDPRAGFGA